MAKYHLWLQIEEDDEAGPDDRRFVGEAVNLSTYTSLSSAILEALGMMGAALPHNDEQITEYRLWHGRLMAERQAQRAAEQCPFKEGDEVVVTRGGAYYNKWGTVKGYWVRQPGNARWIEVVLYDRRVAMFHPDELAHRDRS